MPETFDILLKKYPCQFFVWIKCDVNPAMLVLKSVYYKEVSHSEYKLVCYSDPENSDKHKGFLKYLKIISKTNSLNKNEILKLNLFLEPWGQALKPTANSIKNIYSLGQIYKLVLKCDDMLLLRKYFVSFWETVS